MAKKQFEEILASATNDFRDKKTIAFLGKISYGKTVVSTLLYDALANYFLKKHGNEYNGRIVKGHDRIYQLHTNLFSGRFPPPTPPGEETESVFEISRKAPLGKKIELIMHDISGEDVSELLLSPHSSGLELLQYILTYPDLSDTYGQYAYLPFAKAYVIIIDCSEFDFWNSDQIRISQILSAVLDIKKELKETDENGIVQSPIAIVLTKADSLKGDSATKSAEELIRDNMPEVYSNLSANYSKKIGYFKLSLDATERTDTEIQKAVQDNMAIKQKQMERENYLKQIKIDEEVKLAVSTALSQALAQGHPQDEAQGIANAAGETKRTSLMRQHFRTEESTETDYDSLQKYFKYKINTPVKYSVDEYVQLILWMITNLS